MIQQIYSLPRLAASVPLRDRCSRVRVHPPELVGSHPNSRGSCRRYTSRFSTRAWHRPAVRSRFQRARNVPSADPRLAVRNLGGREGASRSDRESLSVFLLGSGATLWPDLAAHTATTPFETSRSRAREAGWKTLCRCFRSPRRQPPETSSRHFSARPPPPCFVEILAGYLELAMGLEPATC